MVYVNCQVLVKKRTAKEKAIYQGKIPDKAVEVMRSDAINLVEKTYLKPGWEIVKKNDVEYMKSQGWFPFTVSKQKGK